MNSKRSSGSRSKLARELKGYETMVFIGVGHNEVIVELSGVTAQALHVLGRIPFPEPARET